MDVEALLFSFPIEAGACMCVPIPTRIQMIMAVGLFSAKLGRIVLPLNGSCCTVNSTAGTRKWTTSLVRQPQSNHKVGFD